MICPLVSYSPSKRVSGYTNVLMSKLFKQFDFAKHVLRNNICLERIVKLLYRDCLTCQIVFGSATMEWPIKILPTVVHAHSLPDETGYAHSNRLQLGVSSHRLANNIIAGVARLTSQ